VFIRKELKLGAGTHEPEYEYFHGHISFAFAAIDGAIDKQLGEALSVARHCGRFGNFRGGDSLKSN